MLTVNLSIHFDIDSITDLAPLVEASSDIGTVESINIYQKQSPDDGLTHHAESPIATAEPETAEPKPAKRETAVAKKKRLVAEKKAKAEVARTAAQAAKTEAEAETADADDLMDDGSAGEVTLDNLKGVVKTAIEQHSIDAVKQVFTGFSASKISDLATEQYAPVKTALEAL